MRLSKAVVKNRVLILIVALLLLIPSVLGMANTRINYDMLDYLPEDMDTVVGQNELLDEFGKGAFSLIVVEDMPAKDVAALRKRIEAVEHVDSAVWYDSLTDLSVPMEILPEKIYNEFNNGNATMLAVFFDSSTSADVTMDAIREIRAIAGRQCFVTGMSALVTDLKDLCEREEPIYVALAVACACLAMMLLLDSWLAPLIFLASIGICIVINLGSTYFLGEISYITKALSAVLQLAVTMDYSIFLWNSYNEQRTHIEDKNEAMAKAIHETFVSVLGSSITTIAGFIALCFMSFTMGRDLGIVMAKGVLLGVIGCVTVLPSLILLFDRPLQRTRHKALIRNANGFARKITKAFPVFLAVFVALAIPAYMGYAKTNEEVYYDMGQCLPQDINYVIAHNKLTDDFDMNATHMVLADADLPVKDAKAMLKEIKDVKGVKFALGLDSVLGSAIPRDMVPSELTESLKQGKWQLMLVQSEYKVASDEVNQQCTELNRIIKKYDDSAMLIGEAPCTKDLITITDKDFKVVNAISIIAVFLIIAFVFKSISLPVILVATIEFAIFINLGIPCYTGTSLPFIASIVIGTIQLGSTVDYAILMTTRYRKERCKGREKKEAIRIALSASIGSIVVSALGFFAATFGVGLYSDIDMISSLCTLMARGALISMLTVIFILPSMLMIFDNVINVTTKEMKVEKIVTGGHDHEK